MNNNQWEVLTKLIIPAILLVFWAINQIFHKDLTAPRVPRNLQPGDEPIPPGAPARRAAGQQPTAPRPRVNPPRPMGRDDDIVIISSENRSPARPQQAAPVRPAPSRASSSAGGPDRSAKRSRSAGSGGSRSSQQKKRTAPGDLMTGLQGDQTLMIGPLSEVRGMDQVHLEAGSAAMMKQQHRADTTEFTSHASLLDIRRAFRSPVRLREAILMSELLQPPVSRRRPRR